MPARDANERQRTLERQQIVQGELENALAIIERATEAVRSSAPDAATWVERASATTPFGAEARAFLSRDAGGQWSRHDLPRWAAANLALGEVVRRVDVHRAIGFLDEALQTFAIDDPSLQRVAGLLGPALLAAGTSRLRDGDAAGARPLLERAEALAAQLAPTAPDRAFLNEALGVARRQNGDVDGAVDAFFVALQIWVLAGEIQRALGAAHAMTEIGRAGGEAAGVSVARVLEGKSKDFDRDGHREIAAAARAQALSLRLEVAPSTRGTGVALENAAKELEQAGAVAKASEVRRHALQIFEALDPNSEDTAVCLTSLASDETELGLLTSARARLVRAKRILDALPPDTSAKPSRANRAAWIWSALARVARFSRDLDAAQLWARRAVYDAEQDERESYTHAYMLSELGWILLYREEYADAIDLLTHALRILEVQSASSGEVISQLTGLAHAHRELGHTDDARALLARADVLTGAAQSHNPGSRAGVLLELATLHREAGEHEQAEGYAQQALDLVRSERASSPAILTALNLLGQIRLDHDDENGALLAFEEAIPVAERVREDSAAPGYQGDIFAEMLAPYRGAIRALLRRADHDRTRRAFAYAERSRATDLIALLGTRATDVAQSPEVAALLERERALLRQIAEAYERLAGDIAHPERVITAASASGNFESAIKAHVAETVSRPLLEQELEVVRSEIRARFPTFAGAARPDPVGLDEIQRGLPADTLLLAYTFTADELQVWTVSTTALSAFTCETPSNQIIADVTRLVLHFRERSKPKATRDLSLALSDADRDTHVARLSRALLGRVPPATLEHARDLRIVPDGVLHYLPFELLTHPELKQSLIRDHAATYGASATVLHMLGLGGKVREWQTEFIGYGDVPPPTPGSPAAEAAKTRNLVLGPLEHTRREIEQSADLFGARGVRRLAGEATEYSVRTEAAAARYVHFATHGLVGDGDALHSGLLLAPPKATERSSQPLDDYLQTFELFDLQLSAELVVGSACRTVVGRLQAGEGVRGMAHALFAAGARCVILSLWSVPDNASAELMIAFYRGVRTRKSIARALADAKNEVRKIPGWADPFYWAAFVALGPADLPPTDGARPGGP